MNYKESNIKYESNDLKIDLEILSNRISNSFGTLVLL